MLATPRSATIAKPRPLQPFDPAELGDYVTVTKIAELMDVSERTVIRYANTLSIFPKPAFKDRGRKLWQRKSILDYLATKPRLLAKAGTGATINQAGKRTTHTKLPEYLTRADIGQLLDVAPRIVSDAIFQDPDFPAAAFGDATNVYATDDVLKFLRMRERGALWTYDESVLDPTQTLLTQAQIASLLGVAETSVATFRVQRDKQIFPRPSIDPDTGKPYRPLRFHRQDVHAYLDALDAGRVRRREPTELSIAFRAQR